MPHALLSDMTWQTACRLFKQLGFLSRCVWRVRPLSWVFYYHNIIIIYIDTIIVLCCLYSQVPWSSTPNHQCTHTYVRIRSSTPSTVNRNVVLVCTCMYRTHPPRYRTLRAVPQTNYDAVLTLSATCLCRTSQLSIHRHQLTINNCNHRVLTPTYIVPSGLPFLAIVLSWPWGDRKGRSCFK